MKRKHGEVGGNKKGKVFIASKNMRGIWAPRPKGSKPLDVTSAQSRTSENRRDFSPMTHGRGYKTFHCFENYWQSGKVIDGVSKAKSDAFWRKLEKPKRRYPGSKGKKVLYAQWGEGEKMDYITSRLKVYVPEYHSMMISTEMALAWKERVESGEDVVVYDFDGPRSPDGAPVCLEVTDDLLREKLHNSRFPFGHGFIVAAHIAGLDLLKIASESTHANTV
jgi:hypothetical protein